MMTYDSAHESATPVATDAHHSAYGVADACSCWSSRSSDDEAHASITPSHVVVSVRKLIAHATPSRQPRP
eukprot:2748103-Prymnesium_polylepis.1